MRDVDIYRLCKKSATCGMLSQGKKELAKGKYRSSQTLECVVAPIYSSLSSNHDNLHTEMENSVC